MTSLELMSLSKLNKNNTILVNWRSRGRGYNYIELNSDGSFKRRIPKERSNYYRSPNPKSKITRRSK